MLYSYQQDFISLCRQVPRVAIWVASRQIGKSITLAAWAIDEALGGRDVTLCSASLTTCTELMRKISRMVGAVWPGLRHGALTVQFPGGGKLIGVAANPRTARSFSGHLILDEADWYAEPEEIWTAAFPIASRAGRKIIIVSDPRCDGSWLHGRVQSGAYKGCIQYTSVHEAVACGCPIDVDSIRHDLDDPGAFEASYECVFTSRRLQFFDLDKAVKAQTDQLDPSGQRYMGIDVGRSRDSTVATIIAVHGQRIDVLDQLVLTDTGHAVQSAEVETFWSRWHPEVCVVDARILGATLFEDLDLAHPGRVERVPPGPSAQAEMAGRVRALLDQGLIRLPHSPALIRDFRSVRRSERNSGIETERSRSGGHGDRLWSLAYAVHAAREHGPLCSRPIQPQARPRANNPPQRRIIP